jgi:hypothetical protein
MANQADESVYSHHLDRHLTVEDNNSAVELFCKTGADPLTDTQAVLYALWPAEAFSVRMWDYGDDYRMPGAGPETPVPNTPVVKGLRGASEPERTTPATPHRRGQRFREKVEFLDNIGFSHFDAVPELAFENAHSEAVQAEQVAVDASPARKPKKSPRRKKKSRQRQLYVSLSDDSYDEVFRDDDGSDGGVYARLARLGLDEWELGWLQTAELSLPSSPSDSDH